MRLRGQKILRNPALYPTQDMELHVLPFWDGKTEYANIYLIDRSKPVGYQLVGGMRVGPLNLLDEQPEFVYTANVRGYGLFMHEAAALVLKRRIRKSRSLSPLAQAFWKKQPFIYFFPEDIEDFNFKWTVDLMDMLDRGYDNKLKSSEIRDHWNTIIESIRAANNGLDSRFPWEQLVQQQQQTAQISSNTKPLRKNPYSQFTDEQQVMGDKAEELGYVWDRSKYPTPAWTLYINYLTEVIVYDRPFFNIPVPLWNRELRLWAADCAERVVPIWVTWAQTNRPDLVSVCEDAIRIARAFALGKANKKTMEVASNYARGASIEAYNYYNAEYDHTPAAYSHYSAYSASLSASRTAGFIFTDATFTAMNAIEAVYYGNLESEWINQGNLESERIDQRKIEIEWQQQALAKRIDAIAPWRLR